MDYFKHKVYADAIGATKAVETFSMDKGIKRIVAAMGESSKELLLDAPKWLKAASEPYQISANFKDYILVPIVIMPSDLPNRNQVAFPLEQLSAFNPEAGQVAYKTWIGKPTYANHSNDIIKNAKGVIFDSVLRPMAGFKGDIYKVVILAGFDRTKDAHLANQILTGERTSYSMGAYCADYQCSLPSCGKFHSEAACPHLELNKVNFHLDDHGHLAYWKTIGVTGFETSSVDQPAFPSATNPNYMLND